MQYSERNGTWQDIPYWADFLVKFGFCWPERTTECRRVALVSMPCDSPAAGLVTLGAMRKLLENHRANDINQHFIRLQNGTDRFFRQKNNRGRYRFDHADANGFWVVLVPQKRDTRWNIHKNNACDWHFDDEPLVEVIAGNQLPYGSIYRDLINQGGEVQVTNLRHSHSGICLAGRVMGETKTREIMADFQLKSDRSVPVGLDQLLTVHGWSHTHISRVSFFNARTKKRDRETTPPCIVVADGDGAFLTALDYQLFSNSDIIATIDRTLERDRLEAVTQKMASMSQWYVREEKLPEELPHVPKGISVAIWMKR